MIFKNSGASLVKSGPFGAGSLETGILAEFLRSSTTVFAISKWLKNFL